VKSLQVNTHIGFVSSGVSHKGLAWKMKEENLVARNNGEWAAIGEVNRGFKFN